MIEPPHHIPKSPYHRFNARSMAKCHPKYIHRLSNMMYCICHQLLNEGGISAQILQCSWGVQLVLLKRHQHKDLYCSHGVVSEVQALCRIV